MNKLLFTIATAGFLYSCSTPGIGLFSKKTPHELYGQALINAGLHQSALGRQWFASADSGLNSLLTVTVPYAERGYFDAAQPGAVGLRFPVIKGEKIQVEIEKTPPDGFALFLELWKIREGEGAHKLLKAADSTETSIEYDVDENGSFLVRLQPELLKNGEYQLRISSGPSLAYPIQAPGTNHIRSFWGAARDGGARSHEGIDLFAARGTPVVAAAEGRVTRVNENRLGGKVVWMQAQGKDISLYYAHLDSQLVSPGQTVSVGDTLGLMGNTGNARSTPPHLHFGIYTRGGAVDPLPFVNPARKIPKAVPAAINAIDPSENWFFSRTKNAAGIFQSTDIKSPVLARLPSNSLLRVLSGSADWLRVWSPGIGQGFIRARDISSARTVLRSVELKSEAAVLALPDSLSPSKRIAQRGEKLQVLGSSGEYHFVRNGSETGWIRL